MSVMEAVPDVVVPDSIEAVEEWRTWTFDGTSLVSITNGTQWKAGEPLKALCSVGEQKVWSIIRGGWSLDEARLRASSHNQWASNMAMLLYSPFGVVSPSRPRQHLTAPQVEPPEGYGYTLETVTHDAPNAHCSCGIYAGRTPGDCPAGDVLGKVKMWGTVVPGEKGSRSEFAYPSELHVPAKLANHPALLAYGVPIVVVEAKEIAASTQPTGIRKRTGWVYRASIAMNVGACLLNLGMFAAKSWL